MTIESLEKKLKPLESPLVDPFLRWLYLHLPPQPIRDRDSFRKCSRAAEILLAARASSSLAPRMRKAIARYLAAVIPFLEAYEKAKFPNSSSTPEETLRFLMDQHGLTQYDLAKELGGQPVVSDILRGKRRLTRKHIERLSRRFAVSPMTFFEEK